MNPRTRQPTTTITPDAAAHVLHHFGYTGGYPAGSFIAALLQAWDRADPGNSARLAAAFPAYGAALELLVADHSGVDQLRTIARQP